MSQARTPEKLLGEIASLKEKLVAAEEAERAAWAGQSALSRLVDNLPGMAYRLVYEDGESGRFEYLSAAARRLTGHDSGRLMRDPQLFEKHIVHPDDVDARRNVIRSAMERQEPYELTYRLLTGNGTSKWVAERGFCVYDEDGKVTAREGFVHDMCCLDTPADRVHEEVDLLRERLAAALRERESSERQRQVLQRSLRHSQRLESLGSLALGLAHDFNNILQAILGYGRMALGEVPEGGGAAPHIEKILEAAQRANGLTMRLLTFCGEGEPAPEPQQIDPLLRDAVRMLRSVLPATVKLDTELLPEPGLVVGDSTLIVQVLVTLATMVSRQLDASGGKIELHVGEIYLDSATEGGGTAGIGRGPCTGITVGEHQALAECGERGIPWQATGQIEQEQPGLVVVRDIVAEMGGCLVYRTSRDGRLVFRVHLPVCEAACGEEGSPRTTACGDAASGGEFASNGERILFIDDEQILVDLGTLVCEDLGYRVTACSSSTKALRLFENDPASFDVVLTDQTMPDLTGFELAQQILSIRPDIPIILTTGYSEMVDDIRAREVGIREYVMKPITPEGLAAVLRRVLDS